MRRVLVLGGRGYVGSRTVQALRTLPDMEVAVGSRGEGDVQVDLTDETTFERLAGWDAVVNCADVIPAPPDAAIAHVLETGGLFLESTANTPTIARLLDASHTGSGTLVLGVGLFPGLSNIVAAAAARDTTDCESLDLAIRFTTLAGSGRGTVNMMDEFLQTNAVWFVDGKRIEGGPMEDGPTLPFKGGARKTIRVAFSEALSLRRTLGLANLSSNLAPVPAFARPFAVLAFKLLPRFLFSNPLSRFMSRLSLRILRTLLLRWRSTWVEIVAVARGPGGETMRRVRVTDGMVAIGHAIAALVDHALAQDDLKSGLLLPDQVIDLEESLKRMQEQGCEAESAGTR